MKNNTNIFKITLKDRLQMFWYLISSLSANHYSYSIRNKFRMPRRLRKYIWRLLKDVNIHKMKKTRAVVIDTVSFEHDHEGDLKYINISGKNFKAPRYIEVLFKKKYKSKTEEENINENECIDDIVNSYLNSKGL